MKGQIVGDGLAGDFGSVFYGDGPEDGGSWTHTFQRLRSRKEPPVAALDALVDRSFRALVRRVGCGLFDKQTSFGGFGSVSLPFAEVVLCDPPYVLELSVS